MAVDGATERTTVELRAVQKDLIAEQAEVQRLRGQVDQLTAQQRPQEPVAGSVDWGPALTALFRAGASVITFQSIQGKAGGELTVDGTLPDVQALARFDVAMREVSDLIDVQSMEWDQQKNGLLTLTATIKERQ
ncbi:MAG: hypothetical protein Q8O40_05515 [Chloroflexota bacterium]|nr:hypothetical protein [Chloroflexota bacterium]